MDRFMMGIPTVLGAVLILVIGWLVAGALAAVAVRFFRAVHTDRLGDRIGVNDFLNRAGARMKASDILGEVIKWVVRLVFIEMAADQLGLPQVTAVVNSILFYIPKILVAMLVLALGAFFGQILSGVVRGAASEAGMSNPNMLARLASGTVMVFAIIAAINQLDIAPVVVNTLYIGFVAALSLAFGLAFGLGGRDAAARLTEQWLNSAQNTAQRLQQNSTSTLTMPSNTAASTTTNADDAYAATRGATSPAGSTYGNTTGVYDNNSPLGNA
jgi:hypothetical protein